MPTFVHGKSTDFELDDTGGTSRSLSTVLTSVDFPEVIETAETTAFGATSKSYIVGLRDATISVSGLWDATVDGYIIGMWWHVIGQTCFDPDTGERAFDDGDDEWLFDKNARVVNDLANACMAASGLTEEAAGEAGKDSSDSPTDEDDETLNDDSISD